MSNFSKVVFIIVVILSAFFIKEKICDSSFRINFDWLEHNVKNKLMEIELPETLLPNQQEQSNVVRTSSETAKKIKEKKQRYVQIYFLALDDENNGIYKKITREVPQNDEKFEFAVRELLKGPNIIEKTSGTYSEIPSETKLLGIKKENNKIVINLSSDFQYGGGTDSIYSRMMQLIKTSIDNADNNEVYLYIEGKQIKFIGGEGIMIAQPLSEKSLEI